MPNAISHLDSRPHQEMNENVLKMSCKLTEKLIVAEGPWGMKSTLILICPSAIKNLFTDVIDIIHCCINAM
jgi:hypothetical protein